MMICFYAVCQAWASLIYAGQQMYFSTCNFDCACRQPGVPPPPPPPKRPLAHVPEQEVVAAPEEPEQELAAASEPKQELVAAPEPRLCKSIGSHINNNFACSSNCINELLAEALDLHI